MNTTEQNHATKGTSPTPKSNPAESNDSEVTQPGLATLLACFTTPDGKPKYGIIAGKPVIFIDVKTVLTVESEKFQDKLLCDGLTMNAGDACVFSCTFCYVPEAMLKLHSAKLAEFNRETGLSLGLEEVVIRRRRFLDVLKKQLLHTDGSRIYDDPNDNRVLYSSTLVDVAGNMELLRETAAACILIFENTEWQIRLLSKSPLLKLLVTNNLIPEKYHQRLILGFSTGTLDDKLAAAIERGTGMVSKRIEALHELQDRGIRTFGMICPSLPYGTQEEYDEFSRAMCDALRVDRCEHVWAEVINLRGNSLTGTVGALRNPPESKNGKPKPDFSKEADRLETVSGPGSTAAWEEYARMTFEAHQKHVAADKLRFLQYVKKDTVDCWSCMRSSGALLLGSYAEDNNLITIGTSAPTEPLPELGDEDIRYRMEREKIVTKAVNDGLAAAKALHEINTYRDGLLWRKEFRSFADYCASRWGYQKSQAYRHVQAGGLLARLEQADSPIGEKSGITETHLRPVLENVPEDLQVECWKRVIKRKRTDGKLTAAYVKKEAKNFLKMKGVESKKKKPVQPTKPDDRANARSSIQRLEVELCKVAPKEQFQPILEQLLQLIDEVSPHVTTQEDTVTLD
jgi:DNA repair photolyase